MTHLISTYTDWATPAFPILPSAEPSWRDVWQQYPDLRELEKRIEEMAVPVTMPDYGRLWLEVDQTVWHICGTDSNYRVARSHLHGIFTARALQACPDVQTKAATVAAGINTGFGFMAVHLGSEVVS
ncbi:MAG: hypothetical protein H8E44_02160 [Planctomycetes bacterium]|nr:hypothetical protein [Planctomycetota bacterium]